MRHPRAMCMGGRQDPALPPTLHRKGENIISACLGRHLLSTLLPLPMSWVLSEPHKYSPAPLATAKGMETGSLGQTGLGGLRSLPSGKAGAPARLTSQPNNDLFIWANIPEIAFYFFRSVSERKSTSRAFRGISNSQIVRSLKVL